MTNALRWMTWIGLPVTALASALGAPWVASRTNAESSLFAERSRQAAQLSSVERARVLRNFDRFEKLTAAEQQQLRSFHAELAKDPEMASQLSVYTEWLGTLSPGRREDLRRAGDAAKRIELVKKFRASETEEIDQQIWDVSKNVEELRRRIPFPRLSPDDLDRLMTRLAQTLPIDVQRSLQATGTPVLAQAGTLIELCRRNPGAASAVLAWPRVELVEELIGQIQTTPGVAERLKSIDNPLFGRAALRDLVYRGVVGAVMESLIAEMPQQAELQAVLESMSSERREQLLNLPNAEAQRQLIAAAFAARTDPFSRDLAKLQNQLTEIRDQFKKDWDGRPPFWRMRPGESLGAPGRRGPPNRPDDGMRRPDDRRPDERRPDDRGPSPLGTF